MSLLDKRLIYAGENGFEYPQAHEFWCQQEDSHWIPQEIKPMMGADVNDWDYKLTPAEKSVIGRTLKGFVQTEVLIEDYWATKVTRWFKKFEIQSMAASFANMESIHAVSYAMLQEELRMRDFDSFMAEPSAKEKINRLIATKGKSKEEIAMSLAVFSAFNEGVNLFSSFAILMSFSLRNLLKGVSKVIEYSIRDETLHSNAGCWLFRTFVDEYPEVATLELKENIYDAARLTVALEDSFIDQSFSEGPIESINSGDLKNYIRFRTNTKLKDLGLNILYKNLDKERLENMSWFSVLSKGRNSQDFFAANSTNYSIAPADFSKIWNKNDAVRV